ncbi:MAG: hypothetical protein J6Q40_07010 [Tidjanibacter sp.]|nr:hypothetical protein [Tidjanibacter sp.]
MNNETFDWNSHDPLFDEVVAYARGQNRLTASGISKKFCIGFNRACRIIRQIEEENGNNNLLCRKLAE